MEAEIGFLVDELRRSHDFREAFSVMVKFVDLLASSGMVTSSSVNMICLRQEMDKVETFGQGEKYRMSQGRFR